MCIAYDIATDAHADHWRKPNRRCAESLIAPKVDSARRPHNEKKCRLAPSRRMGFTKLVLDTCRAALHGRASAAFRLVDVAHRERPARSRAP